MLGSPVRALSLAAMLLCLAVAASSCGSPSPTPSPTAGPSPTATPTPQDTRPTLPGDILDLATAKLPLTVFGIDPEDFAAGLPSLGHGDFNGDGEEDLIIGAPFADGPDNEREDAGEAYVIFGGSDLPDEIDLATTDADVTIFGASIGDNLGFSALGADVNSDGTDDIIVGAPGTTGVEDPRTDQGEIYVFFGSPDLDGTFDIAEGPESVRITGAEGFSRLGHAIAVGDVNGDGDRDLVLGAPFAGRHPNTPPGSERTEVGEAYVIFGGPGLEGYVSIISAQQDFAIGGQQQYGQFGAAVAAADLNDDGIDDIVVGAPQADAPDGGADAAGAVYVFLGARGLGGRISIAEGDQDLRLNGTLELHNLGFPLASGDLNDDGIADLAVGARGAAGAGDKTAGGGAVYILFGGSDFTAVPTVPLSKADAAVYGPAGSHVLPTSLASGDVDGDGVADLVIGSTVLDGSSTRTTSGGAYVALGGELTMVDLGVDSGQLTIVGAAKGDALGAAVTLLPSGGGRSDVVLLAASANGPEADRAGSGAVYVVPASALFD